MEEQIFHGFWWFCTHQHSVFVTRLWISCSKMECSASLCKNDRSMGCVMFPFPSDPTLKDLWTQRCRNDEWTPDENARLCEVHFELSQYEHKTDGLLKLKPNAVPTLFNFFEEVTDGLQKNKCSDPLLRSDSGPSDDQSCIDDDEESSLNDRELADRNKSHESESVSFHVIDDDSALCDEELILMTANDDTSTVGSSDVAVAVDIDLPQGHEDSAADSNSGQATCRLCASTIEVVNTVNVFEAEIESFELINIIRQCLQIQIYEEDNLPKNVCLRCCEKLADFFEFFTFCSESQRALAEQYQDKSTRKARMEEEFEGVGRTVLYSKSSRNERRSPRDVRLEDEPDSPSSFPVAVEESGKIEILKECISPGISTQEVLENYRWECTDCGKDLGSLKALRIHHSDEHHQPPSFKCMECGQTFTIYRSFIRHVKIHNQPKRFGCTKCGKKFAQKNILQSHMMLHTNLRPFACPHCDKSFRQQEALYAHMKSHLPKGVRSDVVCPVCRKRMSSTHRLSTHLRTHSRSKDFTCTTCGTKFVSKATLEHHRLMHNEAKANYCDLCAKTFQTVEQFNKHNVLIHPDVQFHQCHVCGKDFRDLASLRDHARCHLAYICEYCGKGFRSKALLRVHLTQHSGRRPYRCTQCSRTFSNAANLNQHTRAQHGQVIVMDNDPLAPVSLSPFLGLLEDND
ncbi:Alcohol dehydrogenase transcription factor Myb/SANT-like [Nesidiocoris tenuis]|uniref:Alcohol dehydrogenase transcription factor Myb/SANT-like n=1 Tax=Nesidiocoris tenuis TaxID=355587 RepID=A0ABN7AYB2_9HEMI|nr:Alcohol dehydrogenase transcription factor Myb/SANT-like [Nesidiocoris tenuis]